LQAASNWRLTVASGSFRRWEFKIGGIVHHQLKTVGKLQQRVVQINGDGHDGELGERSSPKAASIRLRRIAISSPLAISSHHR
jgi:hypothetical protein